MGRKNKGYVATGFQWLRDRYGVPARKHAPVTFNGRPGRVVGYLEGYPRIRLDGDTIIGSYHPRSDGLVWLEENGPATAVPVVRSRMAPAPMLANPFGEPQWSGV